MRRVTQEEPRTEAAPFSDAVEARPSSANLSHSYVAILQPTPVATNKPLF